MFSIIFLLAYTESILYKCLLIFNWKKCAAMDDDFWGKLISIFNVSFAFLIAFIRFALGNLYHGGYEILSGNIVLHDMPENAAK